MGRPEQYVTERNATHKLMITTVTANFTEANRSTSDAVRRVSGVSNLFVALAMAIQLIQPAI